MPLVRVTEAGPAELFSESFHTEKELEDLVVASPNLLAADGEPRIALVRRQVTLPEAGILDVLLVDASGLPIVAEAKLARNSQSRREVVGQVLDYVSVLTSMTVDEIDQAVSGAVEAALRSLIVAPNKAEPFDALWQEFGNNLRAGLVRYVILVDEAPPELERIVQFLAARSNLDISLVSITKYRDTNKQLLLVPHHIVRSASIETDSAGTFKPMSPELQATVAAYNPKAAPGYAAVGRAPGYRQIRPPGWPGGLHYEFLKYADGIGVELHLESDAALAAAVAASPFAGPARPEMPHKLTWDPKWSRNRGRLMLRVPSHKPAETAAAAMTELIKLTYQTVTNAISPKPSA